MARIFTTTFEFNHQRYDAIVTVTGEENKVNFSVKLLDADLHDFLPNGQISYHGQDGFEHIQTLDNTVSQSLMRKIGAAIKKHMVS
jgi:hypothetical protein